MTKTKIIQKLNEVTEIIDKLAGSVGKLSVLFDKIPRIAEMLGVSYFAGKASERLGGSFELGALSGVVADGLVHSNLPHNQVGAIPLAAFFASVGVLNVIPEGPTEVLIPELRPQEGTKIILTSKSDCLARGGTFIPDSTGDWPDWWTGYCRIVEGA